MNSLEFKMIDVLKDLKENHSVLGVKAEFESEGARFEEVLRLKDIVSKAGLELTIKIGGCEAIKDMLDAKNIGAKNIVAPMIESEYAMRKFVNATKNLFSNDEYSDAKFYINIETITGYKNINEIINSQYFKEIEGCVLGRMDMTASIGLGRDSVNSDRVFEIASEISNMMLASNRKMVVGGGVSVASLPFFKKLPYITEFETRKVIFNASEILKDKDADKGILKALDFELMWLKNKREHYGLIFKEDSNRITMLEALAN